MNNTQHTTHTSRRLNLTDAESYGQEEPRKATHGKRQKTVKKLLLSGASAHNHVGEVVKDVPLAVPHVKHQTADALQTNTQR